MFGYGGYGYNPFEGEPDYEQEENEFWDRVDEAYHRRQDEEGPHDY